MTVVVEVLEDRGESVQELLILHPGRPSHIDEGTVAVVAVEDVGRSRQPFGTAHDRDTPVSAELSSQWRVVDVELQIASHVKVQPPVAVVVSERGSRAPFPFSGDSRGGSHFGKGSVAVVPVQKIAAVVGDEQVDPPVVVVVGRCHAVAQAGPGDSGIDGHLGEGAVPTVAEQEIGGGGGVLPARHERGAGDAVDDVEIGPSVVVVVDPGATATVPFDDEFLLRRSAGGDQVQTGLSGDVSQDWQGLGQQKEGWSQGGHQAQERCLESRSEGLSNPHPAT